MVNDKYDGKDYGNFHIYIKEINTNKSYEIPITAEYKGCKVAHNVTVLPTLTGNDLTKKYGQSGAYEAKLVDGQGKAYANQKIEFNINGVMYQRTTNADGVAKLNINLQAGKYIITACMFLIKVLIPTEVIVASGAP